MEERITQPDGSRITWQTEEYVPTKPKEEGGVAIAQEVFDDGLVFLVNQAVLHNFGFALGVTIDDDGHVTGLNLHRTSDPDGIWFDEDTIIQGRRRLHRSNRLGRGL